MDISQLALTLTCNTKNFFARKFIYLYFFMNEASIFILFQLSSLPSLFPETGSFLKYGYAKAYLFLKKVSPAFVVSQCNPIKNY